MAWFERFRGSSKRVRPVGDTLERVKGDDKKVLRKHIALKSGIFVALVVLTLAAFPRGEMYRYTVEAGEEWIQETLTAPFDFPLIKDAVQLANERAAIPLETPPYFREHPEALQLIQANRDTIFQQLGRAFDAYVSAASNRSRGRLAEAAADSILYMTERRGARVSLTEDQWRLLAEDYQNRVPGVTSFSRGRTRGPRLYEQLLQAAWEYTVLMHNQGIMNIPIDSVRAETIIIRNDATRTEQELTKGAAFGINEAFSTADAKFIRDYEGEREYAGITSAFFRGIFAPSLHYLADETEAALAEKAAGIIPNEGGVSTGEVIIREGDLVTDETVRKLTSLEKAQAERTGNKIFWKQLLGQFVLVAATYVFFFLYLYLLRRNIFDANSKVFLLALLFMLVIGLFGLTVRMGGGLMYLVPVTMISLLLTVIFDSRVGMFGTVVLALLGGLLMGFAFEFAFATIFAGSLVVFSVRDIKNRAQFFVSAGVALLGYLTVMTGSWLLQQMSMERFLWVMLYGGVNSFLLLMAYPLLWVFERAFNITTDVTLLELSDTNRPLLKELSLRAPGTLNHSLQVANLAEAAADAIGANALLTRVGALYHDIGKMDKPEYFVENQRTGLNPHDNLKPRMSALIIASHVKEGLEMGRAANLPQPVLDFIPMHHGTTRIEYFYHKALEQRGPDDPPVQEADFRYPGPRPLRKEAGILMLADAVEAAARTVENPNHKRLETLIEGLINARINDGQLAQTDLTFNDLNTIKVTFLSMLLSIYHVRVRYPTQDAEVTPTVELEAPAESTVPVAEKSTVGSPIPKQAGDGADVAPQPGKEQRADPDG